MKSEVVKVEGSFIGKIFIIWCSLVCNIGIVKIKIRKFIFCCKNLFFEYFRSVV